VPVPAADIPTNGQSPEAEDVVATGRSAPERRPAAAAATSVRRARTALLLGAERRALGGGSLSLSAVLSARQAAELTAARGSAARTDRGALQRRACERGVRRRQSLPVKWPGGSVESLTQTGAGGGARAREGTCSGS
jgi:hypothetical protein